MEEMFTSPPILCLTLKHYVKLTYLASFLILQVITKNGMPVFKSTIAMKIQ